MADDVRTYLVVDLEGTCCNDGSVPDDERETIEIAAVAVDAGSMRKIGEFDVFVKPVRHPVLTEFCCDLTGIQQSDVDGSDEFPSAFSAFVEWAGRFGDALFCSWGTYDRDQFGRDCDYHRVPFPFKEHLNLSWMFREKTGKRRGHRRAMKALGLEPQGRHHSGICDARNIASMLPFLI